jgi:DNA-binding MarR family transcriptional regulator
VNPTRPEIEEMVTALFAVTSGLERARRKKRDAARLAVLQMVSLAERVRPSEVAAALDVHPSHVTRQVKVLEDAGQVRVEADPADRRSCFVSLTDEGRAEVERLTEVGMSRFAAFVGDWDGAEVRELTRLLVKFRRSADAVAETEQDEDAGRRATTPRWRRQDRKG